MMAGGDRLAEKGWIRFPERFSESCLDQLESLKPFENQRRRLSDMAAITEVLPDRIKDCLIALGFRPEPLRAIGFNKSSKSNWSLGWHQDRVIAMPERIDDPDLTHWTRKNGVWHCEPDVERLNCRAFLHIAFDPMTSQSGRLEMLERTHLFGKIEHSDIGQHAERERLASSDLSRGEALFVSALLLHRSGSNITNAPRRALRLDFEKP